jgi:peptidoglycan/LPS O-acetylase OafA/YrhL
LFGSYRALLAVMVVLQHLGGVRGLGVFAVFGFFVLSGFLMTRIMHATYGYSRAGVGRFALNRCLRIYPIYWVACLLSIALVLWLGTERSTAYKENLFLPDDLESVLRNLLIVVGLDSAPSLTPPAWALTVELFYYACIGLGLSRTPRLTVLWFAASVVYVAAANLLQLPPEYQYSLIPAGSLPFAIGGLIHHFGARGLAALPPLRRPLAPACLFALMLLNHALSREWGTLRGFGFYLNIALNALIVLCLSARTALPGISRRLDERLGSLSYPIYLIHFQAGLLLLGLGLDMQRGELGFALVALPPIVALAGALTLLIENPIERVRERVKNAGMG